MFTEVSTLLITTQVSRGLKNCICPGRGWIQDFQNGGRGLVHGDEVYLGRPILPGEGGSGNTILELGPSSK